MATDTIDRFQIYSWWSLVWFGLAAEYDLLLQTDVKTLRLKWIECLKRIMCKEVGLFRSGGDKVCVGLSGSRGERGGASSVPVSLQDNWFPPPPWARRLLSSCPLIRKCYDYVYHWVRPALPTIIWWQGGNVSVCGHSQSLPSRQWLQWALQY